MRSIYAKTLPGNGQEQYSILANSGLGDYRTIDEQWSRPTRAVDTGETGGGSFWLCDFRAGSTGTAFHIWGAQAESTPFATSLMASQATTSRSDTDCSLPLANAGQKPSLTNDMSFFFRCTVDEVVAGSSRVFFSVTSATGTSTIEVQQTAADAIIIHHGGIGTHTTITLAGPGTVQPGDTIDVRYVIDSTTGAQAWFNKTSAAPADGITDGADNPLDTITFGNRTGASLRTYITVESFGITDEALEESELLAWK